MILHTEVQTSVVPTLGDSLQRFLYSTFLPSDLLDSEWYNWNHLWPLPANTNIHCPLLTRQLNFQWLYFLQDTLVDKYLGSGGLVLLFFLKLKSVIVTSLPIPVDDGFKLPGGLINKTGTRYLRHGAIVERRHWAQLQLFCVTMHWHCCLGARLFLN